MLECRPLNRLRHRLCILESVLLDLLYEQVKCPGVGVGSDEQTLDNLCGDLNKGYLPVNPIGRGHMVYKS